MASHPLSSGSGRTASEYAAHDVESALEVDRVADDSTGVPNSEAPETAVASRRPPADRARQYRTERLLLETQVAALERTVETQDRQLAAVVERYERLLEERTRDRGDDSRARADRNLDHEAVAAANRSRSDGLVGRLRGVARAMRSWL